MPWSLCPLEEGERFVNSPLGSVDVIDIAKKMSSLVAIDNTRTEGGQ